jgi:hypothetical protein
MDFEIIERPPMNVKIYGQELKLKRPTVSMIEKLNSKMGEDASSADKFIAMRGFLIESGVGEELLSRMAIDDYAELVEKISAPKKK